MISRIITTHGRTLGNRAIVHTFLVSSFGRMLLVLCEKSDAPEFFAHPLRRYLLESVFVMQTAQNGASLLLDDYAEYGDLNVAALECLLRVPESLGPVAKIGCVARTRDRTATLGRSWLNCGDRRSSSGVISHLR